MISITTITKKIFFVILSMVVFVGVYLSTSFVLSLFPVNTQSTNEKDQTIYVLYNNIHSDIVLKLDNISDKWIKELPLVKDKKSGYITFGWGDKETYLNTPTWDEMKISTSLKALFINTSSLVHINYYPEIRYFKDLKPIEVSREQLSKIKKNIFKSFNFKGKHYKGYGQNDLFYSSPYKYNFIYTCNTWTGKILRNANIPISKWTPLSTNIISSLPSK